MRAGQLNHRITIKQAILTRDVLGGFTKTLSSRGTFWARIEPFSAREPYLHQQLQHEVSHRITTRKFNLGANGGYFGPRYFGSRYFGGRFFGNGETQSLTTVKGEMLVVYGSRTFKIIGIRDLLENGVTQEILAQELPAK